MESTAIAGRNKRCFRDLSGGVARSGTLRTRGSGFDTSGLGAERGISGTESTGHCGTGLIRAFTSSTVGRLAGLRFKHCRTIAANAGGRAAGKEAVSDLRSGHEGRCCVSASTMVIPRPHISPAAEKLWPLASGGSYMEDLALLAVDSPAGRTVSLASFS